MKTITHSTLASTVDRLAVGYQLKIHLLGISPQISRRVLVRSDTTLAELHHIFQLVMGWENWHLHRFHLWGKDYGISYAGGTWYADDTRRVHLDDFPWRVNDKFTYTYDFGDYWQHQVRVEKILLPPAVPTAPVCVSGRRACPPEEIGGPSGYDQRTLDQFSWRYESLARLLAGEDIREDDVPTWFWTYQPEHFDKGQINRKLAKLYQLKGNPDFLLSQGGYDYFFADLKS
ncbi:MAG: plasmid pRiA4b ORF-3 family protein [Janthinobacterium lividum]